MNAPKRLGEGAAMGITDPGIPRDGLSKPVHGPAWELRRFCAHVFWSRVGGAMTSRTCGAPVMPYERSGHLYYPATCPDCSALEREERCNKRREQGLPCYCKVCKENAR